MREQDNGTCLRNDSESLLTSVSGIAIVAVVTGHSLNSHAATSRPGLLELLVATVVLVATYRVYMSAIYLSTTGLKIVNPLRSTTIPWDDVARSYAAAFGRWPLVVHVQRRDGSVIAAFGVRSARARGAGADRVKQVARRISDATGADPHISSPLKEKQ